MAPPLGAEAFGRYNADMNPPDIELEALKLPTAERARLVEVPMESLGGFSGGEGQRLTEVIPHP